MKRTVLCLLMICSSSILVNAQVSKTKSNAKPAKKAPPVAMKNALDSFSYAVGMNVGESMKAQSITDINSNLMMKGIWDILKGDSTLLTNEAANMKIQEQIRVYMQKKTADVKATGAAFLQKNKARKEVTTLPDGLQYEVLKAGNSDGVKPTIVDTVVVHYVGTLIDGTEFDGSVKRGQPAVFKITEVIRGWTEILQMMTKGSKWKVYIPSELGYGDGQAPGGRIPPGSTLIFEMELIDIKPGVKQ